MNSCTLSCSGRRVRSGRARNSVWLRVQWRSLSSCAKSGLSDPRIILRRWLKAVFTTRRSRRSSQPQSVELLRVRRTTALRTLGGGHNERQNIQIVKTIIKTIHDIMAVNPEYRKLLKKQDRGADGQVDISWINDDLITYVKDRLGHDQRYGIDPTKIKNELGWYPETDFETGIVKTIRWNLDHHDWVEAVSGPDYQKYYDEMYAGR